MSLNEFRQLLARWRRWVALRNLASLGYAQSRYTELVGAGAYRADPADDTDLEILEWDEYFRTQLPPFFKEPLIVRYLIAGPEKAKSGGSGGYYNRLRTAEEGALTLWLEARNSRVKLAAQRIPLDL